MPSCNNHLYYRIGLLLLISIKTHGSSGIQHQQNLGFFLFIQNFIHKKSKMGFAELMCASLIFCVSAKESCLMK